MAKRWQILLLLGLFAVFVTWAVAQDNDENIVIPESVFVRSGPGEDFEPVGALYSGDTVLPRSISEDGQWLLIGYRRGLGWIERNLVDWADEAALDALPVLAANVTPTPDRPPTATLFAPTETPQQSYVLVENAEAAYVRAGPGRGYLRLGQLLPGATVEAISRNDDTTWIMIRYEDEFMDGFAWIARELVQWQDEESLQELPIILTDELTPTLTFTPSATQTASATPSDTATATDTVTPSPTATNTTTSTATATDTVTPSPTATDTPTNTATATDTVTPSPTATDTPTSTATATDTVTPSPTATDTPTSTATATDTVTPSPTATATLTETPSATATQTASATYTPEPTETATKTAPPTATAIPNEIETEEVSGQSVEVASETSTVTETSTETHTPTLSPTRTPSPTLTDTATPTATSTPQPTETVVPSSDTPEPSATDTAMPTATNTEATAEVELELTGTSVEALPLDVTEEATEVVVVLPETEIPTLEPPTSASPDGDTDAGSGIAPEAVVAGILLVAVLIYLVLYAQGAMASRRYADGFVIEQCPVCQRGNLHLEERGNRVLGIPRTRYAVRCDECRSVLREKSPRIWYYSVDRLENPTLYERYNGREITDGQLERLSNQTTATPGKPIPPQFVDRDLTEDS